MLRKHLVRYLFKHNKWMLLAISGLLIIMCCLFFSLSFMNNSYKQLITQLEVHNQEHFQFMPTVLEGETIEDAVLRLEQHYHFKSEQQAYKLYNSSLYNIKVIKQSDSINKHILIEGHEAVEEQDIVYDINTAKRSSVDEHFNQSQYTKVGVAFFPSQLTPNMSLAGYEVYNPETSYVWAVSNATYNNIPFNEKIVFSGVWTSEPSTIDKKDFTYFLDATDNVEINGLNTKYMMNQMIAGLSVGVLSTIVFIMLFMLIYKMIKDNEQYFGILKSIGYSNKQFFIAFFPFTFLFIVPVVVSFIGSITAERFLFTYMNSDLSVPYYPAENSYLLLLLACIILVVSVNTLTSITLLLLLRRHPVALIQGVSQQKMSSIKRAILNLFNRTKGMTRLQLKFMFSHSFVLFLTLFTGFALGVQLLLSFSFYQFPSKLVEGIEEQFTYDYNIKFNQAIAYEDELKQLGVAYIERNVQIEQGNTITPFNLIVIEQPTNHNLLQFKQYKSEININDKLEKGILISKWMANKYNLKSGDVVQVDDGNGQLYNLQIADIHIGLQGSELYTSFNYYSKMTNDHLLLINGVFTNSIHADLSSYTIIEQQAVLNAANKTVEQFNMFSLFILIIGIILGLILFAIALYIVLQNGQKHMLLLKTMGYSNKQVSRITIEGYLFILLIGVIISGPYLSMLSLFLFDVISKASSFYLPIESTLPQIGILVVFTIAFFYAVSLFYMKKIAKMRNYSLLINE